MNDDQWNQHQLVTFRQFVKATFIQQRYRGAHRAWCRPGGKQRDQAGQDYTAVSPKVVSRVLRRCLKQRTN